MLVKKLLIWNNKYQTLLLSSWAFLYFNFQPVEMESLPDKKCVDIDIADANDDDDDDVDFPSRRRTQSLGQQTQKN